MHIIHTMANWVFGGHQVFTSEFIKFILDWVAKFLKQGKFFTGNDIETEGLYVMENGIEMEWVSNLMLVGEDGALDCDCLGLFTGNYKNAGFWGIYLCDKSFIGDDEPPFLVHYICEKDK